MAKPVVVGRRASARQDVGVRLRMARESLGLTQQQFAEAFELTKLSVLQYEAGRTPLPTDLLPCLEELGIDSAWVATGTPTLAHLPTRKRFTWALQWVKRESAIHGLTIALEQEVKIAWCIMIQHLQPTQANECQPDDEVSAIVRDLIANRLG